MRSKYRRWHAEEMTLLPPAYGIALEDWLNVPGQRGYACATCGKVFAEVPVYTFTLATALGPHTFARCSVCVAQHRYLTER